MAKRLKRQEGVIEVRAYEVFELELDDADRADLAKDPTGFLRKVIEDEGQPINALYMDEKFLTPNGGSDLGAGPPIVRTFHCIAPPEAKSAYITIVS